jgi:hypothetical protein
MEGMYRSETKLASFLYVPRTEVQTYGGTSVFVSMR